MKMTRDEVSQHFRGMSNRTVDFTDVYYTTMEVDVCDIEIDGKTYQVPASVGHIVSSIVEDTKKANEMIPLGNLEVRAYLVKKLFFHKGRFTELGDWGKAMLLEEQPDLFKEWEDGFSPRLKARLAELKKGASNKSLVPAQVM